MSSPDGALPSPILFLRHGATALNVAGLRCGGDIDLPLNELGHHQAAAAARRLAGTGMPVGVIVVSELQRARQTADIVARCLRGVDIVVDPAFNERRLGEWNRRPVAETERELAAGVTPPGGESNADFADRVRRACLATLLPLLPRRPLLVSSKGVARVLGELSGHAGRESPGNGQLVQFDLGALCSRATSLECAV